MITPRKQLLPTLLVLLACVLCFEFTSTDMRVQQWFYDTATAHWLWERNEPVLRFLLYTGLKGVFILFGLGLLVAMTIYRRSERVRRYRRGMLVVLLSLMLVPLAVGTLKSTTNVACPKVLTEFGGSIPHVTVLQRYPDEQHPASRQQCWPAGHASGGFALMSLYYLFFTRRNRLRGLWFGIASGWISGFYKMVIGDHFLSHTVVTWLLAWLIINLIASVVLRNTAEPEVVPTPQ